MRGRILLIDAGTCELTGSVAAFLESRGHHTRHAHSSKEGLRILSEETIDAVVVDEDMHGASGADVCRAVHALQENVPVIVMTTHGTMDGAIAAIRAGGYDFVTKPFDFDSFAMVIDRALAQSALQREVLRLRSVALAHTLVAPGLVGQSPALDRVRDLIARVADVDSTVLITGESGTGKELVARALHDAGCRKGKFVAINCAAMPEALLESELFGHARGAFTDAVAARAGLFVQANGGTILLDEIGEMPAGMQAKLLRTLQERRVRAVGSDVEIAFDARIIAATHCDLDHEVAEGRFRQDLLYRINVVQIDVPPLRVRGNDVLLLAQQSLDRLIARSGRHLRGMSVGVAQKLLAHPWPGNVRQLQNCMEHAVAVAHGEEIAVEDLPDSVLDYHSPTVHTVAAGATVASMPTMSEVERHYIHQVLDAVAGNKTLAAQVLGLDRRTLYRKLERPTA